MPRDIAFTVLDLFCGAGGLSLGFVEAGFRLVSAVDSNAAAIATHDVNFGGHATLADLTAGPALPATTVVTGGPPCQGFSSAGSREAGDARNTLVSWFAQTVAELRPRAFVFENVEGFLTTERGTRVFDLLDPLLAAGYHIQLRKVNAANYGAPQHRKRILAIGGLGWTPSFPEPTHSAFGAPGARLTAKHLPLCPTFGDAIGDLPDPSPDPPGRPDDHYATPLAGVDLERARALTPGQTMRELPVELQHKSYRRRASRRVMDGTPLKRRGGAPAGLRRLKLEEPSKAITSAARTEFLHPVQDRNITLRECARLQTFPDDFVFQGSPSERMQLIANAVPPSLAQTIALSLARDLKGELAESGTGRLVSFVPTFSRGMSPALERLVHEVSLRYLDTKGHALEQRRLWA